MKQKNTDPYEVARFELMRLQHKRIAGEVGLRNVRRSRDRWQRLSECLNTELNELRARYGMTRRKVIPRLVELGRTPFKRKETA